MFVVGLDLSVRCSGCSIWDPIKNRWYLSAFAVTKKQPGRYTINENVQLCLFPIVPSTSEMDDTNRYLFIERHIISEILSHIPTQYRHDTHVVIEDYCLKSNQKKTAVQLHEEAACIKRALVVHGFTNIELVLNQTWKSVIHSKSKLDTVRYIHHNDPNVDLLAWFNKTEDELPVFKNKFTGKTHRVVPSPIQDIADSCAIAIYGKMTSEERMERKKQKKPKLPPVELSPLVKEELEKKKTQAKELKRLQKEAQKTSAWANSDPVLQKKKRSTPTKKHTTTAKRSKKQDVILIL